MKRNCNVSTSTLKTGMERFGLKILQAIQLKFQADKKLPFAREPQFTLNKKLFINSFIA